MNRKIAALALALLIALAVAAYYSINTFNNSEAPQAVPTPIPTLPPTPNIPTDPNTSVAERGEMHSSYPTQLTIISPQNTTYQTGSLTLKVNVTTSSWIISSVYYKADWLKDYHRIYSINTSPPKGYQSNAIILAANFTGIPEGNHTIEVVANYHDGSHTYGTVNFNVGT